MHPRIPTPPHSKRLVSRLPYLPNELLGTAFSFLHRHDLASVVRVCRSFRSEGQSSLYRYVELSNESKNLHETIALLGTDRVGAYVRGVALTTTSPRTAAGWFPPNLAQYWVGLRRLELSGIPFVTSQDLDVFRTTLQTHCRKLQILAYRHDPCVAFPGDESGLLGERGERRDHMLDFDNANQSVHSLTHITFTGPVFHCLGSSFETFINLRFPNLKSLELDTLAMNSGSVPYAATTASVTRFVVEHDTIEHLSLSKRVSRNGLFFHLDGPLIAADILPNLRSFEGCPATFTILARRGVLSVFRLTSLSLFACEENLNDISAMVGEIKSSPAQVLDLVVDLRVEFLSVVIPPIVVIPPFMEESVHVMSSNGTSMREIRCLDEIAGLCPNVVNYSGTFPALCATRLKATFALYPHLETISVPWYTLLVYMEPSGERKYFAPLAESLPSLNTVVARKPRHTNFKDQVFTFVRNPAGEVCKVNREEVRLAGSAF